MIYLGLIFFFLCHQHWPFNGDVYTSYSWPPTKMADAIRFTPSMNLQGNMCYVDKQLYLYTACFSACDDFFLLIFV